MTTATTNIQALQANVNAKQVHYWKEINIAQGTYLALTAGIYKITSDIATHQAGTGGTDFDMILVMFGISTLIAVAALLMGIFTIKNLHKVRVYQAAYSNIGRGYVASINQLNKLVKILPITHWMVAKHNYIRLCMLAVCLLTQIGSLMLCISKVSAL